MPPPSPLQNNPFAPFPSNTNTNTNTKTTKSPLLDSFSMQTFQQNQISRHSKHRSSDNEDDEFPLIANAENMNGTSNAGEPRESIWVKMGFGRRPLKPRNVLFPSSSTSTRVNYPKNVTQNQKYSLITFLPLILLEQFKFFFNLYFLLVAMSQLVPALQIGYLFTYFAPLGFVLFVTISKEAYDDYQRYKRDQEANSQIYRRMTETGTIIDIPSSKIEIGNLIYVDKDQRVPADMILLRTTEKNGSCFIRTDQLDGETDWKLRLAIPSLQLLPSDNSLLDIKGVIYADRPHKDIYNFIGNIRKYVHGVPTMSQTEPLSVENTLWANTVVASGTALGIVIYTGHETRAVMNTSHPSTKVGLLDHELNMLSKILCAVLLLLSFTLIAMNRFSGLWYVYMMRFLIIFSSIIPISLRVNLDMGRTVYSFLIMRDENIPDTIVRTSTIPEELGRIEYLLTDKTGTLTKNDMELKKLHMGTMSYGLESLSEITRLMESCLITQRQEPSSSSMNTGRSRVSVSQMIPKLSRNRDISSRLTEIVQALALCHNVTPVTPAKRDSIIDISPDETYSHLRRGNIQYQASSPDEIAIVKWTELAGLMLVYRDTNSIILKFLNSESTCSTLLHFDIIHVFPFTSETKRMGIIVREQESGEITFYMKGADVVMSKIVQYNDWLEEECGNMAREGLRTLVIARKKVSEELLAEFNEKYQKAKLSIADRNENVQAVISQLLEHDLELLGLTGVEDKLQDDVKTTLETLRNAGIKIWMLTGDKIETATNIAISSRLCSRNQAIYQIQKLNSIIDAENELDRLRDHYDCCLVIDGSSLQFYLDHLRDQFMAATVGLPAVVCCRCSPTQKASTATLIKEYTHKRVCCIGDGGNDVSMIQAAHVGVGIVGKEGKQASLAADFSVTQFSHLTRLLLWHGRNSYKRSAKMSQFVIHRGLIISIIQAVFSAIFFFTPIALYQGMILVGYSTIYTMAPVFSLVLDIDVNDEVAMMYPELYKDLTKGRSLSLRTFFTWLLISLYQGSVIMMLAIWLFEDEFLHIVSISFTALIFNELLMVALEITTWHPVMIYSEVITMFVYMGSMFILKNDFDLSFILTGNFVWKTSLITVVSCIPLYILRIIKYQLNPPIYTKISA